MALWMVKFKDNLLGIFSTRGLAEHTCPIGGNITKLQLDEQYPEDFDFMDYTYTKVSDGKFITNIEKMLMVDAGDQ